MMAGAATTFYNDMVAEMRLAFPTWRVEQHSGVWVTRAGLHDATEAFVMPIGVEEFNWTRGVSGDVITSVVLTRPLDTDNTAAQLLDDAFALIRWATGGIIFDAQDGSSIPNQITLVDVPDVDGRVAVDVVAFLVQWVTSVKMDLNYVPPPGLPVQPEEVTPAVAMRAYGNVGGE